MTPYRRELHSLGATRKLAAELAAIVDAGVIYLQGDLGAGKTELVRAWLRALGVVGTVRSPTYTLVEPYELGGRRLFHLDLYRLSDAEELEYLGLRDWAGAADTTLLVEWPERGAGVLPAADLHLGFDILPTCRIIHLQACSERAEAWLQSIETTV